MCINQEKPNLKEGLGLLDGRAFGGGAHLDVFVVEVGAVVRAVAEVLDRDARPLRALESRESVQ